MPHAQHVRRFALTLLALLTLGSGVTPVGTAAGPFDTGRSLTIGPILTGAICVAASPSTVMVTGRGFSPGGLVDIRFKPRHDLSHAQMAVVVATTPVSGPNGSQDPAMGFSPGGLLNGVVPGSGKGSGYVDAFDRLSATWSNALRIEARCEVARTPRSASDCVENDPL